MGTIGAGFYTLANSTSMNLIASAQQVYSLTTSAQFSGIRIFDITNLGAITLTGGLYYLGLNFSFVSTASWGMNLMGGASVNVAGHILTGTNSSAATNSASRLLPMWGVWNATSGALPAAVAASSISGGNGANSPDAYAAIMEYT